MLTVESLVSESGLDLTVAGERAKRAIRWVHISELEDPTQWLSGGELLLTTGIQLSSPARQRRFVERLAEHDLAGLGLGTGFSHRSVPKALADAAAQYGLPLFEVPYEMPFIAITERAFSRLVNEEYDVLQRDARLHERLERLVIEGRGIEEILATIAGAAGGVAVLNDSAGVEIAVHRRGSSPGAAALAALREEVAARAASASVGPFEPRHRSLAGRSLAVPVPGRRGASPVAWLTVLAAEAPLDGFERLVARHGAMVVGLEMMRERVVRETERRLAGNLLAEALGGRLDAQELRGRLGPFGIGETAALLVFDIDDPEAAEATLEAALHSADTPTLVATTSGPGNRSSAPSSRPTGEIRSRWRARRARRWPSAGAGCELARRARCPWTPFGARSTRRAARSRRRPSRTATHPRSPRTTTSAPSRCCCRCRTTMPCALYSDGLLEPIERVEGEYGGELLRSLEAYIEHNGNWERAARELYCHRHTLRYRMRKIEELTGRDLTRATDRIELWLALRARELVR